MAADRAATMATTIHASFQPNCAELNPLSRNASRAPVSANGRAKTECSNLIISSVKRSRFRNISPGKSTILPMTEDRLRELLEEVQSGAADVETALRRLKY